MSEWQPIETAPRDGSWFVTCNAEDGPESYEVGRYDPFYVDDFIPIEDAPGTFKVVRKHIYDWTGFNNFERATHWMPLPPSPTPEPNR